MKKNHYFSFLILLGLLVSSCSQKNDNDNFLPNSPIIFTEFQRGNSTDDRVVEIANISEEVIALDDYHIDIYRGQTKKINNSIKLDGYSLASKQTLVIAYDEANPSILEKADYITHDLFVDGTWPLILCKGNYIVDVLGTRGYQIDFGKNIDLVRKEEFMIGRDNINNYDWIRYSADDYSHLGTIETTISEDELLYGPQLTEEDFHKPFAKDGLVGGGGAIEVSIAYLGDGDTTNFRYPSSLSSYGINSVHSTRYLKINTPEIQHGTSIDAQPWGYAAQDYNNDVLSKAKHVVIQTELDYGLFDTYGRLLAYVWYTNTSNPTPEDYRCLNCELLTVGLAFLYFYEENSYADVNKYKGVSYTNIFKNDELYAKNRGLKIHGEKDPSFPY